MAPDRPPDPAPASSEVFIALAAELAGERVSVGDLADRLAGRGVGILLLVFSLPLCIPNIPGISTLFGVLLMAPSLQMIFRRGAAWIPAFARNWTFDGKSLRRALVMCGGILHKVDWLARRRLSPLTGETAMVLAGLQTLVMALVLLLPMPGANVIPGVAVALTGLAILQKDGLFMLLSTVVAILALAWVYFGGKYIFAFGAWLYHAADVLLRPAGG